MSTTITTPGEQPITPTFVEVTTAKRTRSSRTVAHSILAGDPVYTLRPADPPQHTLKMLFTDEQEAVDCADIHALGALFTIDTTDLQVGHFQYVVRDGGRIDLTLDTTTANTWIIEVEVAVVS